MVPAETRAPAKPMSAFGSARLTSPRTANEAKTPPVVGSVRTLMYGTPAARSRSSAAQRLGQLHQRERALLHPRPARGAHDDERHALGERVLGGAGHLLADDRAHRAAHEPEVHDADRDRAARSMRPVPQTAASRIPVAAWAAASRSGYGFWSTKPSGIDRLEAGVALLERALVEQQLEAGGRRQPEVVAARRADADRPSRAAC